ncbi:hypothetical protein TWF225_002320 [Orbilia oligospora]|nr:hypothetical protein TWF225_002320 [Orbilia oligospora]KAF3240978.1 hypothetical protein TWF217_000664 [Orbilia oligospora]KAF3256714.1 hypothetical protein TWF128_005226 [Orbilia oligospora]KAF3276957.1 hypothetical protein TWF132_001821 [Orbilia oligospora]
MADSTRSQKHGSKPVSSSKPDSQSKSKKPSSGAKPATRAKDAEKQSLPKSSKSKSKKNDITAENADVESITPTGDAKDKSAAVTLAVAAPTKPSKERKDKRFVDLTPDAKQAKRREERQRKRKALEGTNAVALTISEPVDGENAALATVDKEDTTIPTAPLSKSLKPTEKPSLRLKREKKETLKAREWKVSQPIGGRYSTNNVVFSTDEKYILLAQGPSLKVFSTKTSLLYRTLQHLRPPPTQFPYSPDGNYSSIANYTLDPANSSQVYIILFNGDLLLWDYTEGTIEGYWKTDLSQGQYLAWCGLRALPSTTNPKETTLWTYHEHSLRDFSRKTVREIRALTIPTSSVTEEPVVIPSRLILSIDESRPRHLVIIDSNTFVVDSGDSFYVGNRQRTTTAAEVTPDVVTNAPEWRIRKISTPGKIMTIDAIIRHKKSGTTQGDVAVGHNTGQIFVYHDVLNSASSTKIVKSKLHWHRTGVGCIKYSKDGTYLISGGRETVLVLWQLSTSSRQTLPNLGADIKTIVLSPTGSTYALILADNSILTISTTELKPTASISGIQSRVFLREEYQKIYGKGGKVSKTQRKTETEATTSWRIPVLKHPWNDMQILLAAPASQKGESSYPYLQTFDLAQDRGVARQAITRTLVSMKNVDPEGGEVKEPNVRFLGISGDGEWLASVDEWAAPARDFVDPGAPQPALAERIGKEVVLRFWRWSGVSSASSSSAAIGSASGKGSWELISMIESPHGVLDNGSAGDVADLTGSPKGAMFASVGGDGTIKIWGKRTRTRAGVKVEKDDMVVWNCRRNLELFKSSPNVIQDGRLAYSGDGSVVAVSYADADDEVVTIIDPVEGVVKQEIGSLQTGRIFALTFVGRYLVIGGAERVVIWNLVSGVAEWGSELKPLVGKGAYLQGDNFVPNIHLAGCEAQGTFAISVNYPLFDDDKKKGRGLEDLTRAGNTASMVSVFEVEGFGVLSRKRADNGVLALEAANNGKGGQGYFWLDGAANVYFMSSGGVVSGGAGAGGAVNSGYLEDIDEVGGLANAFLEKAVIEEEETLETGEEGGDEKVVRSHMLSKLFPAPAYASPAVGDVFGRFMEIVGQKALDLPKSSANARTTTLGGEMEVKLIEDDEEGSDDEFEDAHDGDADVSMQDVSKDAYADLPARDFDVIIDEA